MRRSEQEKAELLEKWRVSGKSRSGWCKEQGVSITTLNRWKEKSNSEENGRKENETIFAEAKVNFSDDCANFADEVRLRVPVNGKALEIYCAAEKSVLKNVLEAVAECL
jgi:hypothetical protein